MWNKSKDLATATKVQTLYVMENHKTVLSAHVTTLQTCHARSVHLNKRDIVAMQVSNVMSGVNFARAEPPDRGTCSNNLEVCSSCVSDKAA